jgi:hypothetical protein
MPRLLLAPVLLVALAVAGCAYNRADFVAGPDGKPQTSEVSDTGKTVGDFIRNHGPSWRMSF